MDKKRAVVKLCDMLELNASSFPSFCSHLLFHLRISTFEQKYYLL
jgi:hypothetical protein